MHPDFLCFFPDKIQDSYVYSQKGNFDFFQLGISHFIFILLITKHLIIVPHRQKLDFSNNQVGHIVPSLRQGFPVCVCVCVCARTVHTLGCLNNRNLFSQFLRPKVQDQGAGRVCSSEAPLLGLQVGVFSLCLHMVLLLSPNLFS